jgi:uncharacterized membrane protein YeaQ/YmgE (transglycosylase-associated protein family)
MGFVVWIVAGALAGCAASALAGNRDGGERLLNVAIGIAGVLSGGWLLGRVIGASAFDPGEFSVETLLVSLLGVAIPLTLLQAFRESMAGRPTTLRDAQIIADFAPVAGSR